MKKRRSPFFTFLCCVLAVPTCGYLIGTLTIPENLDIEPLLTLLQPWLAVGTLLGIARLFLRPILRFFSAPLGCLTFGLFGFVIDVALVYLCAYPVENFATPTLLYAVLTSIFVNIVSAVAGEYRK
jgi:putative membrane protein